MGFLLEGTGNHNLEFSFAGDVELLGRSLIEVENVQNNFTEIVSLTCTLDILIIFTLFVASIRPTGPQNT